MDDQESPSILSETKNNNDQTTNNDDVANTLKDSPPSSPVKKRRGAVQLIKVALYMIRRRSGKSKTVDVAVASSGGSLWNCLVGSVRPLHLQTHGSPRHHRASHDENDVVKPSSPTMIQATSSPMSVGASSSYSSDDEISRYASAGNLQELDTESRYASATNLKELDNDSECDDRKTNNLYDENGGDEMIDLKAEEFIAQFYKQIRLQRLNSMDRHYNEMIQRSIG